MTREEWNRLTADEQWGAYCRKFPIRSIRMFEPGHFTIEWQPPVDDKGNPPPVGIYGDMIPTWYDGQWWIDWSGYCARKRKNGEQP